MTQHEESKTEMVLARNDWEAFMSSLERLISVHRKTMQRLKELKVRNDALRIELRNAIALPTLAPKIQVESAVEEPITIQVCRYCNRETALSAKYCDTCGRYIVLRTCDCGRELGRQDRFCDRCGRTVESI